jgi:hypothetical protein
MESMTVQVLLTELETARESLDRAFACLIPAPKIVEALNNEQLISGQSAPQYPPIKFVTENGFTIERVCETEASATDSASGCHFVVRGSNDEERRVTVAFSEAAILLVQSSQRSIPLSLNSPFWLRCAERDLATYLWEKNSYPPAGRLTVDRLSDENLRLAIQFN